MGEFIAGLARAERIFLALHVAAGVPFPDDFAARHHLVDEIAVHAAVGMPRSRKSARDASFDLRRDGLPTAENGVSVGKTAEVVMLAALPGLPIDLPVPHVLAQRA